MTTIGNQLLGTWKLRSYIVTTGTGEASTPYGECPSGYITYSADMRMQVIGTADERVVPRDPILADDEQVELFRTMFAYAGTYSPEAGKITHHVDISWNEVWTGTDQVRFYEVNENTLTITSCLIDPTSGAEAQYTLVWEKVRKPR